MPANRWKRPFQHTKRGCPCHFCPCNPVWQCKTRFFWFRRPFHSGTGCRQHHARVWPKQRVGAPHTKPSRAACLTVRLVMRLPPHERGKRNVAVRGLAELSCARLGTCLPQFAPEPTPNPATQPSGEVAASARAVLCSMRVKLATILRWDRFR